MKLSDSKAYWQYQLDVTGYQPKTTFWDDFSIADKFGVDAVRDTFKRAFDEWQGNYEYMTELTLVLNWKIWQLYLVDEKLARVYDELWKKMDNWCYNNFKGEELNYYFKVTD